MISHSPVPSAPPDTPDETIKRLTAELREALEQQAATAEILSVISSSPADLEPTFNAIAAAAKALTGAALGSVVTYDSRLMHLAALAGFTPGEVEKIQRLFPLPADHGTATGRAILTRQVAHIEDLAGDLEHAYQTLAQSSGQTVLAVPMLRDGVAIGAINVQRRRVEPFTEKQIDLIKTFAYQAAIAMENARLLTETREALEQQTATAEVLQVINRSPGDLAPVFDAILEKATDLCDAAYGDLWTYDGECFHSVATHGGTRFAEWIRQRGPVPPEPGTVFGRIVQGEGLVQIADAANDAQVSGSWSREVVEATGARTVLVVPLRKDNALRGAIFAYRQEVRPFTDKHIALLQNFAAQAVIAMENARLLGELREQTDELTRRAAELCASEERYALAMGAINEGVYEWDVATSKMYYSPRVCELVGLPPTELQTMTDWTDRIHPDDLEPFRKAIIAHFKGETDCLEAEYRYRHADGSWHWARQHGIALKNDAGRAYRVVGSTGDITDRKVAEQALREALEQQTATAEVLQVINSSPGDLAPVFDAILEKAHSLCGAAHGGLLIRDGEGFRVVAAHGESRFIEYWRQQGPFRPPEGTALERIVRGERVVHIADATAYEGYRDAPMFRHAAEAEHVRTLLLVPLRKDDAVLGAITAFRQEVRPFSDKQIALLQNFAAQAVIAMENARLITETREALEQQTATAEVLQVINSSPGDLTPVFDAILERLRAYAAQHTAAWAL
jgi:PAS domain S-box-containing protein